MCSSPKISAPAPPPPPPPTPAIASRAKDVAGIKDEAGNTRNIIPLPPVDKKGPAAPAPSPLTNIHLPKEPKKRFGV